MWMLVSTDYQVFVWCCVITWCVIPCRPGMQLSALFINDLGEQSDNTQMVHCSKMWASLNSELSPWSVLWHLFSVTKLMVCKSAGGQDVTSSCGRRCLWWTSQCLCPDKVDNEGTMYGLMNVFLKICLISYAFQSQPMSRSPVCLKDGSHHSRHA